MSRESRLLPVLALSLSALAFGLVLTDVLSGCAVYSTYEKCGLHGCPGDEEITAQIMSQFREHPELEPNATPCKRWITSYI